MRIFFAIFLQLIFFSTGSAQTTPVTKTRHILNHGDVEYVIQDNGSKVENENRGLDQFLGKSTRVGKYNEGKLVHDVTYTIDQNGFRTGPSSHLNNKTKHFFIIDGSISIGEGLQDNETIHELINKRSKTYEAYELGFFGEGPQHHWIRFKDGKLPAQVKQKKGSALIITHEADFGKLTGSLRLMPFIYEFPKLVETSPYEFKNAGTFMRDGTFFEKIVSKYCTPYIFCNNWLSQLPISVSKKDMAFAARVMKSTENMYREQFDVESITILWLGSDESARVLSLYSKNKIMTLVFDAYPDGHPNKKGAQEIVNFLFDKKIIE